MKVLVTGAGGFIGSHLVEELLAQGFQVRAFCHYNSSNSWGWLESLPEGRLEEIDVVTGDVRDYGLVLQAMKGCNMVFHLAALIAIPYSYKSPESYVDTNIKGTLNVLQAARQLEINRTLITSTSEVYGAAQYVPIDENHPKQPQSPYAASKIGADSLAESFFKSFDLPITIVRPFNTYGPRQSARAIIPSLIIQMLSSNEVKVGNITPTRDFLFVKDATRAFVAIAKSNRLLGEQCNISSNAEISIKELLNKIKELINPQVTIVNDKSRVRPKNSEVFQLYGDNQKLVKLTGWKPQYDLSSGIKETVDWFSDKRNIALYKTSMYNI